MKSCKLKHVKGCELASEKEWESFHSLAVALTWESNSTCASRTHCWCRLNFDKDSLHPPSWVKDFKSSVFVCLD